ncbi:hypothetical protein [Allorhodopirellula heiligendammensis]|uniref:hypothetical protein n=1 Tax=Allorhodopirellula heiligendammensis TaxID=2714739 RepID=UPI00265D7314|nr:hypothetical protein [Allorhodopirellula heiligendammensis]
MNFSELGANLAGKVAEVMQVRGEGRTTPGSVASSVASATGVTKLTVGQDVPLLGESCRTFERLDDRSLQNTLPQRDYS